MQATNHKHYVKLKDHIMYKDLQKPLDANIVESLIEPITLNIHINTYS